MRGESTQVRGWAWYDTEVHVRIERPAAAPAGALWTVVADVEAWPRHTRSMKRVTLDGPLRVGAVATIRQPRLPVARWTVTELEEGRAFMWESRGPGVHAVARHEVRPGAAGTSALVLTFDQRGALAGPLGLLLGRLTRRYVTMEAEGLTAAAERAAG